MKFYDSPEKIIPSDYEIFIGLDVDKSSIALTVLDHKDRMKQVQMPYQATGLIRYLIHHYADQRIVLVYEAGPTGYGLYDELRLVGCMCLVTAPSLVPQVRGRRVKTNKIDSRQLAIRLRGGELTGIRVPSPRYRMLRHLSHQWFHLGQRIRAVMCQIKSLLLLEGLTFPGSGWSRAVRQLLRELPCAPPIHFILEQQVDLLECLLEERLQLRRQLRTYCREDEELAANIRYISSLSGIGEITGIHLLARIGDYRHMKRSNELAGFLGLTPWERSTGEREVKGGISRTGDRQVRAMLIESAWVAIRHDPELKEFWCRLRTRNPMGKGGRKAIVAVARKMTVRIYRVLKDQREYQVRFPTEGAA